MPLTFDPAALAPRIETILQEAGAIALSYFRLGQPTAAEVAHKSCGGPVTDADLEVDRFLHERLSALAPDLGWLSEETADTPERLSCESLFIVDPIDGTRGFAAGNPCFAICVAVVTRGRPVLGLVHAPALDETFVARRGAGATRNGAPISVSSRQKLAGAGIAAPDALAADLRHCGVAVTILPSLPSLAMRLVRVADGALDGALARKNACDWDLAAADVILHEAGGVLTDFAGETLLYNKAAPKHPALAAGPPALQRELIEAALRGNRQN